MKKGCGGEVERIKRINRLDLGNRKIKPRLNYRCKKCGRSYTPVGIHKLCGGQMYRPRLPREGDVFKEGLLITAPWGL